MGERKVGRELGYWSAMKELVDRSEARKPHTLKIVRLHARHTWNRVRDAQRDGLEDGQDISRESRENGGHSEKWGKTPWLLEAAGH